MKEIYLKLKELREESGYTQEQVAQYLDIDQGHLSRIERGDRTLNLTLLDKICLLYGCSPDYILGNSTCYSKPNIAFRLNDKNLDLEVVAKINQIMGNLRLLRQLEDDE